MTSSIFAGSLWRLVAATAIGLAGIEGIAGIGAASAQGYYPQGYYAPAYSGYPRGYYQYYYGPDSEAQLSRSRELPVAPRHTTRRRLRNPKDVVRKETRKPVGPLVVSISIDHQKLKLYDANGFFAESPISTGMRGHSTPMGVFSVIQKQKYHRSNIYSGAPMPYMQRITWSGIAMHAGVLPGYPASHGCIRMPNNFAVELYGWTRMGVRVVVAPGNIEPQTFANSFLPAVKVPPAPPVPVASADAKAIAVVAGKADKGGEPNASEEEPIIPVKLELKPSMTPESAPSEASSADKTSSSADTTPSSADKPAAEPTPDAQSADAASKAGASAAKPGDPKPDATAAAGDSKTTVAVDVKPDARMEDPSASSAKATDKVADASATPAANKDESRVNNDGDKPAAAPKPEFKPNQPIAVFISRKDSRLYVRQDFKPVFDVPVTIADGDRPLGTHIFTAELDKTDPNQVHWSVLSLPPTLRRTAKVEPVRRGHHKGRAEPIEEATPVSYDSPAEALDRLSVPPDVMARIAAGLTTGSSIMVSDQGIKAGETGEGTDFIVRLR